MNAHLKHAKQSVILSAVCLCLICLGVFAASAGTVAAAPVQKTFASPEEAVQAYITALRQDNRPALNNLCGPNSHKIFSSGDKVADQRGREAFLKAFDEANSLAREGEKKMMLVIGKDKWPFPVPLVAIKGR